MSTQPLILKNGVISFPRSPTDVADINASLGITAALALKANSNNANLTGISTAVTASPGTNTTQIATTAFVTNAVSSVSSANFVDLTSNQTISGAKIFSGSIQLPTTAGTVAGTIWRNGDALEYRDGSNITKILLNSAGNLSNLMNKQTSLNNLVGAQTANRVLRSDGTNVTLSQVALGTDVTGTLSITNGGTGSSTQNFVDLTTAQTIAGAKTLTSALTIRGDVGIMNLLGNTDAYNTFRFTASINTASSYWDIGVGPSSLNRDFYISSGYAGGGLGFRINATNYNFTLSGAMIVSNTTASTSTTTGSGRFAGGIGIVGKAYIGGGLNLSSLPTSNAGLTAGDVWRNGNILTIV